MKIPAIKKSRNQCSYSGSKGINDESFVVNNLDACLWFLENRDNLNRLLKNLSIKDLRDNKVIPKNPGFYYHM